MNSAYLIDTLRQRGIGSPPQMLYYFCDYEQSDSLLSVQFFRSMLKQLFMNGLMPIDITDKVHHTISASCDCSVDLVPKIAAADGNRS